MSPDQEQPRPKLYQDQLYGAKVLTPLAVALMDSAEFQRLAGLRQLGFADIVYRGAQHTRFAHSVGTYLISRTIMRRIVQNHERLGLEHPGSYLSPRYWVVPSNAGGVGIDPKRPTYQSLWRGLTEVVSAAALIHDISHVPFGHTLEDEFAGLYKRHDRLAGPRLYEMIFNESSDIAGVFSDARPPWLPNIDNITLRQLIYVILSWKEHIEPPLGFPLLLEQSIAKAEKSRPKDAPHHSRLVQLSEWHRSFADSSMFHPFMSDIIGNTICADLLDYLPRDRENLGMESRQHTRIQRYFTIREGAYYQDEGRRLSIMVTRKGRGGQRPDVATAVLDIMHERYEMAERVFYHHKKAAASAMLAKLVELASERRPRGDDNDDSIYPAPWTDDDADDQPSIPHVAHLSDTGMIDYLGNVPVPANHRVLQRRLYTALRFRRPHMYRTLLVVDPGLVQASPYEITYFAQALRGTSEEPSSVGRRDLETFLASAAGEPEGEVLVYCPSPAMQSKEVDARLEIEENRVLPLRVQTRAFVYRADVDVLSQYYEALWRLYILVSPSLFGDATKCQALVDAFCSRYRIENLLLAYRKVRSHDFTISEGITCSRAFAAVSDFVDQLPFGELPRQVAARLLTEAAQDKHFLADLTSGADGQDRLSVLLDVSILKTVDSDRGFCGSSFPVTDKDCAVIRRYWEALLADPAARRISIAAHQRRDGREYEEEFMSYVQGLLRAVTQSEA